MSGRDTSGVIIQRNMPIAPVIEHGAPVKLPIVAQIPELAPGIHTIDDIDRFISETLSTLSYEIDGVPVSGRFDLSGSGILSRRDLILKTRSATGEPVLLNRLVQAYVAMRLANLGSEQAAEHWLAELSC